MFEVPTEGMMCSEVAEHLAVSPSEVIQALFMKGIVVQVNQYMDVETVRLAAAAFGSEAVEQDEAKVRLQHLCLAGVLSVSGLVRCEVHLDIERPSPHRS